MNLEELRMDLNQVRTLPPAIGQMISLRVLTLADNSLTALPSEMSALVNMQVDTTNKFLILKKKSVFNFYLGHCRSI